MSDAATAEPETRIERRGRAGWITLNRPRALNALTLGMVREIAAALDDFERDASVEFVVVTGAGERAFCAGGDIRWLNERGRAGDHAAQLAFWGEEYILNRRIKRYPETLRRPHRRHRDGRRRRAFDAWLASRRRRAQPCSPCPRSASGCSPTSAALICCRACPRNFGAFLALTGLQAKAGDLVALGLATQFTPSADMARPCRGAGQRDGARSTTFSPRFASAAAAVARCWPKPDWIEPAFAVLEREAIEAAVAQAAAGGSELAATGRGVAEDQIADHAGDRAPAVADRRRAQLRGGDADRIPHRLARLPRP